jgi:hypothetical protein
MPRSAHEQVFSERLVLGIRLAVLALFLGFPALVALGVWRESSVQEIGEPVQQPIPFSHKHHVGDDGIDCRYCHTTVETSSFAGMPSTATCMNCHSQVWAESPTLAAVRDSYQSGQPLQWNRVNQLPDFVYFDHSIHVQKGVACETCHGRVDQMPTVAKAASLQMEWCLECHRNPEQNIRPREDVVTMGWLPPANEAELQQQLKLQYHVESKTDCSTCHR